MFSAIMRWKPMPTPSMTASRMAQPMAPLRTAFAPPRTASEPPVKKPAMMAFHGSSFLRTPLTAQSNVENRPPQTPKLPPRIGARALMAVMAVEQTRCKYPRCVRVSLSELSFHVPPILRSPYGELRKPFTPCHTVVVRVSGLIVERGCVVTCRSGEKVFE